ncbi:MAG: TonB-dependent receptor [Planctomycetes bacterium]|nr:TonB-dependent receptor [Planctomycetota bacterium]
MNPFVATVAALCTWPAVVVAQDPEPTGPGGPQEASGDLGELSLEALLAVECEVGGRNHEALQQAAASVFVLTAEQIRRSGLRAVPELLRLVPGLLIAQDVPGAYGFSSRVGEFRFAGMLVLLDGQRLYPTLLRREYWQAIDLPVENIERIEVVRGPGGARWGDKAAQGVINIVTKKAADAQGALGVATVGIEEKWSTTFRAGSTLGEDTGFYVYGKLARRDAGFPDTPGERWVSNRLGTRWDTTLGDTGNLTIDGEYHDSLVGDSYLQDLGFTQKNNIAGGHAKAKAVWQHAGGDETMIRVAFDAYDQDDDYIRDGAREDKLRFREQLFDATLQHTFALAERHRLTVGLGLRHMTVEAEYTNGPDREYNEIRDDVFAAWEWDLGDDLRLTVGGNVGYVDGLRTTGVDVQPDIRLAWFVDEQTTLWGAVAGAIEPGQSSVDGTGALVERKASDFLAWELGLRKRWDETLLLEIDGFVYDVSDQLSAENEDPGTGAVSYEYDAETKAYGGEVSLQWNASDTVQMTLFHATTHANVQHLDSSFTTEHEVPRNRSGLNVGVMLPGNLETNAILLYTEDHWELPTYWRLDLRLGWRPNEHTSIDLVGQNLLDSQHPEYWYEEQQQRGGYLLVSHRF